MRLLTFSALLISVLCNAASGIFFKYAASQSELLQIFFQYGLGLACLVVQFVTWAFALKYIKLSIAYPFTNLAYLLNLATAVWLFHEPFHFQELVGSGLILLGSILLSIPERRIEG